MAFRIGVMTLLLSVKVVLPALLVLPAASVAVALTVTVELPVPRMVRSSALSSTDCDVPVPVPLRYLSTLPWSLRKVTLTLVPPSAETVTAPEPLVATAMVSTSAVGVSSGAAGARVSSTKLVPPLALGLPAPSLAMAVTLMVPWPRLLTSSALSTTATALLAAVTDLVTLPAVPLKTTLTVEPASASTLTAPVSALALAAFSRAAAGVSTGVMGIAVLSTKLVLALALALPARSVATALTLTLPWPSASRSRLLSTTACAAPVPVTVLLMLWPLAVKPTSTLAPDSAATVTAPALFRAVSAPSVAAAATSTGVDGSTVSSRKLVVAGALSCPAERAVALTLTVPWPSVVRSAALSPTRVGLPLAVRLLLTLCPLAVKTRLTAAPLSAVTLTAPALARAAFSLALAALRVGALTVLLRMKLVLPAALALPARSVATALTLTVD